MPRRFIVTLDEDNEDVATASISHLPLSGGALLHVHAIRAVVSHGHTLRLFLRSIFRAGRSGRLLHWTLLPAFRGKIY